MERVILDETLERVIMERARNTGEIKLEQKMKSLPRKRLHRKEKLRESRRDGIKYMRSKCRKEFGEET